MTRILLTGFEPFGGAAENPSRQAVARLSGAALSGAELVTAVLPVARGAAGEQLAGLLADHRPDWCVMLGLAEGRMRISLERVAVNLCDFRIPDSAGEQPVDEPVVPGGPAAYFSTLPLRPMLAAGEASGVPTEVSLSAGAYLCNYVFYLARHLAETRGLPTRAGFIHLPATPELAIASGRAEPSMALDTIVAGVRAMLAALRPGASQND